MTDWSTLPGIWVGAIGTLALFSLIYRENRAYRIFEHLFIGLASGYLIKTTWDDVLKPQWWNPMFHDGQWPWIFVTFLGVLLFTLYTKKFAWMSRITLGVLIGLVAGQIFQATASDYIPQIRTTFKPLVNPPIPPGSGLTTLGLTLNNLLFIVIVICVLFYFFFWFEQKNPVVKGTARTGRLMMMFAFGAIFGSTVMARMALLIDRAWFLMHDWLRIAGNS